MNIEIYPEYIEWVKKNNPELFGGERSNREVVEDYVNEVLNNHQKSWNLEDDEDLGD